MTPKEISLVKESWKSVTSKFSMEDAGALFYNKLFELDPSLRELFHTDIKVQSKKLFSMITFAVDKLDTIDEIVEDVKALGRRHVGYRVKPEHYKTVAEALLWTLEQALGEKWTQEVKDAWVKTYTTLAEVMIKASEEV